ncbi:MAG TPA: DUF2127 domain-containing protein [Acidobacteriaceae bacterium]|jgi:uncharacterized membrane protein (DUF2068 family)|nr:DUF2127 domain-containing protein [Acidobacteriaceae bacterium]
MTTSSLQLRSATARSASDRWIIAIGVFKLLQALLFFLLGIGAVRLLHRDLMDVADHFILAMRFNPEGHLVNLFLDKVALIDPHRLKQISAAIFVIAGLDIIEGTGLVMKQAWAEFVTLILTASFLPVELFQMLRHLTWIRIGLFVINFAVVAYLLYYVKLRMQERRRRRAGRA